MQCSAPLEAATVTAPTAVSVFFSEELEPKFSTLKLLNSMGMVVSKATAVLDPKDAKHLRVLGDADKAGSEIDPPF